MNVSWNRIIMQYHQVTAESHPHLENLLKIQVIFLNSVLDFYQIDDLLRLR